MNDLIKIKEEIYSCGLVVPLLESLGCHINEQSLNKDRIEASLPDGDNPRSVQVYLNESLTSRIRSRSHVPIRDIYDIVSYIRFGKETTRDLDRCIPKSKKYIVETLGFKQFNVGNVKPEEDPNAWLKEIQRKRKKRINLSEIEPNPVLPESILDEFIKGSHIDWLNDGINTETQEEFEVCFDLQTERICLPVRNRNGQLIGIKGRATKKEDENYKYLPIYPFQKSKELFNLHRAMPYIKQKNEVILWEAEKSCLKAWQMGIKNTVSQMGSDITRIQAEIIKRISPDIKIILAFDKDKSANEVKQYAKVFGKYENLYGVVDTKDLIEDKMSPADAKYEVCMELLNNYCYKIFPKKVR